eukprot:TRINITY_DN7170_c0_g1_i1.p1 TRINITY_DN7170_c0_g1~~TRINITY_DN7170_c0_g1_i1.p1  ORF type:complete len:830 (+),score=218.36 TRINITY_DN7170_c0_g1_i1:2-2491(+)
MRNTRLILPMLAEPNVLFHFISTSQMPIKIEVITADTQALLASTTLDWQQLSLHPPLPASHRLMLRLASTDGKRHCPLQLQVELSQSTRTGTARAANEPSAVEGTSPQRGNGRGGDSLDQSPQGSDGQRRTVHGEDDNGDPDDNTDSPAARVDDSRPLPARPSTAAISLLNQPSGLRQFALSVDLHSITRSTTHPQSMKLSVMYRPQDLFEGYGLTLTHPPIDVPSRGQRTIENGFHTFTLVASYESLVEHLELAPLTFFLRESGPHGQHLTIAQGQMQLGMLLSSTPIATGTTQAYAKDVELVMRAVATSNGPPVDETVAKLSMMLTLQDHGPALEGQEPTLIRNPAAIEPHDQRDEDASMHGGDDDGKTDTRPHVPYSCPPMRPENDHTADNSNAQAFDADAEPRPPLSPHVHFADQGIGASSGPPRQATQQDASEQAEMYAYSHDQQGLEMGGSMQAGAYPNYDTSTTTSSGQEVNGIRNAEQAARAIQANLELEMWMKQQQEQFQSSMNEKQKQALKLLGKEWQARNQQQEQVLQHKIDHYRSLTNDLETALRQVKLKEEQLDKRTRNFDGRERDLLQKHERAMAELRDASRRLESDFIHQTQQQEEKLAFHESQVEQLRSEKSALEAKCQQLQTQVQELIQAQSAGPTAKLQARVVELTNQNQDLQSKLQSVHGAKEKYKTQWTRALQTIAQLRQREQLISKEHLRQQQRELEHMRLQYLAKEERNVVGQEHAELQAIKQELAKLSELTQASHRSSTTATQPSHAHVQSGGLPQAQIEIARLSRERQSLLNARLYTPDDPVIRQLDARIAQLMAETGHVSEDAI